MKKNETGLHVKYRPQTLAELRGNTIVVESLKKKLEKNDLPHAFLFYGHSGTGKTSIGRIIATSLGCKDLDVKEINAANNKGIDYIRGEVIRSSWFKSIGGGNKVYLFDEAHCLTQDASNALLKIVEEPPKHAYFIFCTTDLKKMLPALKNRCSSYKMLPLADGEVHELLEHVISEEAIDLPSGVKELVAQASKGVPRQALVFLDMVRDVKSYVDAAFLINQATEFSSVTQAEEPAPQRTPSDDKGITSPGATAIPAETPVESSNDVSTPNDILSGLESWRHIQGLDIKIEWLVDRLIPKESITVVFGKGGIGKTWLMMDMARSIGSGIPFLGLATKTAPVIYIDFENPLAVLNSRIRKMGDAEGVYFWRASNQGIKPPRLDSPNWEAYKKLPQGAILIFDTLRAAHEGDENTSRDMGSIMGRLKELRDMGFTVILLHHTPKNSDGVAKGSTTIVDLADHSLGLVKVKKKDKGREVVLGDDEDDEDAVYRFGGPGKSRYEHLNMHLTFNPDRGFELAPDPKEDILKEMHRILVGRGPLTKTAFNEACEGLRLAEKKLRKLIGLGQGRFWDISIPGPRNVQYVTPKAIPGSLSCLYSGADLPNCPGTVENGPGTNDTSGIPDKMEADKGQEPRKP